MPGHLVAAARVMQACESHGSPLRPRAANHDEDGLAFVNIQLLPYGAIRHSRTHNLLGFLKRTLTITLDFDWFWRGGGRALAREFNWRGGQAWGALAARYFRACRGFAEALYRHHGPDGILARTRPTGSMTFWMTVMLAAYLVFYLS